MTTHYDNDRHSAYRRLSYGVALSALAVAWAAAPALAQEKEDEEAFLDTVIVNAQKKSAGEAAQDVPIALTAFNANTVRAVLADDLRDVGFYSPNTQLYETSLAPGTASFAIRGLGTPESTASLDPAVGLIKDGIFYGQRFGSFLETFDVESIEVLRGPQGTLFGRNVTGGAVVVRTRRPGLEAGATGQLRSVIGSDNRLDVMGYVDATLIENKLGIILSAAGLKSDGYVDNLNAIGGTLGDKDIKNYRAAIKYDEDGVGDLTFIVERNQNDSDTALAIDPTYSAGYFTANRNSDNQVDITSTTYVLEANINAPGGLVTAVAGYRNTDYGDNGKNDLDGGPTASFETRGRIKHDQTSLELRYATQGLFESLDFTVGLFAMDQNLDLVEARFLGPPLAPIQVIQAGAAQQSTRSYALFGQGDYYVNDQFTVTLGARYTYEEKDFNLAPRSTGGCNSAPLFGTDTLPALADCSFTGETSKDWSDFSPKLTLTWTPTDQFLAFLTASKGFRSGGFNSRATASGLGLDGLPIPFDEESLKSYEAGFKSDFWDGRWRLNGSLFFNQVDGLQRSVTGPPPTLAQTVLNAGSADISGIEIDTSVAMFRDGFVDGDSLIFTGNYGYTNADYTFFDTDGDGISDADQLKFSKVSPVTYAAALLYRTPVGGYGDIRARLAYRYESSSESTAENDRAKIPSVKEIDASVGFTSASDKISVNLFVKNVDNYKSFYHLLPIINDTIYPSPGTSSGLEMVYKF